jgi:hypothetical protein
MAFTGEEQKYHDTVAENCKLLVSGYRERSEYVDMVKYPDGPKPETRVRHIQRRGLLDQLEAYSKNRDADLSPKAARGAPRVKKAKLNPELNGFLTLDEITCDIYMSLDRLFEEAGRDRTFLSQPIRVVVGSLPVQLRYIIESGRPDIARKIAGLTDKWVDMARRTLNQKVGDAMFGDTVCGNCGGGLTAPARIEGEDAVVRCIGTPTEAPCGEEYPASEWLELYERQKR